MEAYNGFMVWLTMVLMVSSLVLYTADGVTIAFIAVSGAVVFPLYGLLISQITR